MNKKYLVLPLAIALIAGCAEKKKEPADATQQAQDAPPSQPASPPAEKPKFVETVIDGVAGFQDTPMQPDGKWHVHDPARPQPPVVTPGTFSDNATPPSDAMVASGASWTMERIIAANTTA